MLDGEERPMPTPKWYMPVAIVALAWNLLGCIAYLHDVRLTPDDIAKLSTAQQSMYAARPAWVVAAFAIAVWGGAAGCVGLVLRKRWARPLFIASLIGLIVQDTGLFVIAGAASQANPTALVLQSLVLLISIALVLFARVAQQRGWIS